MKQIRLWVMVGVLGAAVVGAGVWITRRPALRDPKFLQVRLHQEKVGPLIPSKVFHGFQAA